MSSRTALGALALTVLAACSAPSSRPAAPLASASAPVIAVCTHRPTPADVAAAKGAHQAAARFFDRADYDGAIRCWRDAYELDCTARDLLLNIANALEKKGEQAAALAEIDEYLKAGPATPLVRERSRRLRQALASSGQR
jgi:tetratricopeptide (TPR) repeat protein